MAVINLEQFLRKVMLQNECSGTCTHICIMHILINRVIQITFLHSISYLVWHSTWPYDLDLSKPHSRTWIVIKRRASYIHLYVIYIIIIIGETLRNRVKVMAKTCTTRGTQMHDGVHDGFMH